eukprot:TRINITY_DN8002_c0_g1_i1.p1 TRINITY_DN8002_c0_g1~~TRINITY_DN8002_c0_g1_i1.p1  ORF type:complete len:341 (+),score=60.53 TRINITY_DN8002_c0_g1_i1:81-1103(+)
METKEVDRIRRLLVNEPRGHKDMYGCFVVAPDDDAGDIGVVFFHNEGYSTACGHGTIALLTWAWNCVLRGQLDENEHLARLSQHFNAEQISDLPPGAGRTVQLSVDAPSGRLLCDVTYNSKKVTGVSFHNVPSFVYEPDVVVNSSFFGHLTVTIVYGGAFYATLSMDQLPSVSLAKKDLPYLIGLQRELKPLLEKRGISHPHDPRLNGIYGVIFWENVSTSAAREEVEIGSVGQHVPALMQRNVTVFADGAVDRSPCGSGTSARLAELYWRESLALEQELIHLSLLEVNSKFHGTVVREGDIIGSHPSVVTRVTGSAFECGKSAFVFDAEDEVGEGFFMG